MKYGVCGRCLAMTVVSCQIIHKDKTTGQWVPNYDICRWDPDDICLFGLIKKKEARDGRDRAKEARL